jgi:tetratricopeptide (TPR) repeat protein
MVEEATKESLRQSFTEAGQKYETAAELSEQRGDIEESHKLYLQAAETYQKAAEEFRSSKSYKSAARNMCAAGEVYSTLAESQRAMSAYERAAEDLMAASGEHLMWGEDAETRKGAALAIAASMMYVMIGKDAEGFRKARTFCAEHASKLTYPGVVRITQIPQQIQSAIESVDISSFSSAETAAVTELKSALTNANAEDFSKYVDKGLDMAREMIRGKLKVPKLAGQLDLPVDMTFTEVFPIRAVIANNGAGDASALSLKWIIDEGLTIVDGQIESELPRLGPGERLTLEMTAKSSQDMSGEREYEVVLRGSYSDMLNSEYSFQAGPGTFILRDFKMTEKLLHDIDVTEARLSLLRSSIEISSFETEPLDRIAEGVSEALNKTKRDIEDQELMSAKSRIAVVNEIVNALDAVLGDEDLLKSIETARLEDKREFAQKQLASLENVLMEKLEFSKKTIDSRLDAVKEKQEMDFVTRSSLLERTKELVKEASEILTNLKHLHSNLPSAATTDDHREATKRTEIRTAVTRVSSDVTVLREGIEQIANDPYLKATTYSEEPTGIKIAKELTESIRREIREAIDNKKRELS